MPSYPPSTYSVLVLEKLQVGHLVAAEAVDDLILGQEVGNRSRGLLVLLQLGDDLLALLDVLGGGVLDAVELAVHVGDVVGHVGVLEQLDLARQDLVEHLGVALLVGLVALELDQREQQVSAQVGRQVGHDGRAIGRDCLEYVLHDCRM